MGVLTQTGAVSSAAASLTVFGLVDWSDWGSTSLTASDWMSGAGHTIPDPVLIGGGGTGGYTNDPRSISWTNGTFVPINAGSTNGIFNGGGAIGCGLKLTVPADLNLRTLWLFNGGFDIATAATVSAVLSDGSASPTSDSVTLTGSGGTSVDGVFKFVYQANSPGQSLAISWFINANTGNVTLQGAALASVVAPSGGIVDEDGDYFQFVQAA